MGDLAFEHQEWAEPTPQQNMSLPVEPPAPPPPPPPPPTSNILRAAVPLQPGKRVPIKVDDNMERVVREVLTVWGARYCVFQTGGKLVEVQTDSSKKIEFLARPITSPRMQPVGPARARSLASRECVFLQEKMTKDGTPDSREVLPPDWLGSAITSRVQFDNIPPFAGLVLAPTLRSDGARARMHVVGGRGA
jgi:hypothetical protein